jgi:prepilin-type N-terminal cleavage/methylation domain-containing protein
MKIRRGFTLIELLVVIAIIGLLATLAVVSFGGARKKARDAKRMHEAKQIQTALGMYYDEYGHYPITSGGTWASFDAPSYKNTDITNPSAVDLAEALRTWIPNSIGDPKRTAANGSGYLYRTDVALTGDSYCILIWLTPENMNNYPSSMIPPSRCITIQPDGNCTPYNAAYLGKGDFAGGC